MNKTAEEIYPYLENEESSIGIREHNQRMYDCRQAYNKGFAAAQFAAPPPASEGEVAYQIDFSNHVRCYLSIKGGNINVKSAIDGWGKDIPLRLIEITTLENHALATLPTREPEGEEKRPCSCIEDEICGICHKSKGYSVVDGKLTPPLPSPPNQSPIK